jgi:hypothetical protein
MPDDRENISIAIEYVKSDHTIGHYNAVLLRCRYEIGIIAFARQIIYLDRQLNNMDITITYSNNTISISFYVLYLG